MNIISFREDLQSMPLEDALIKHNTTLKTVWREIHGYPKKQKPRIRRNPPTGEKYITKNGKKYCLRRRIKGTPTHFGVYESLEDAIQVREFLEKKGWYRTRVNKYCREHGINGGIRRKIRR